MKVLSFFAYAWLVIAGGLHVVMLFFGGGIIAMNLLHLPLSLLEKLLFEARPLGMFALQFYGFILIILCLVPRWFPKIRHIIYIQLTAYSLLIILWGIAGFLGIIIKPLLSWLEIVFFCGGVLVGLFFIHQKRGVWSNNIRWKMTASPDFTHHPP
ncbi:MAG: hypothetical protein Q7J98_11565 [Kiritimatiellia bacterium]|nr:hypothetical protein [Kiritimatiellia bacterium]